MSPWEPKPGEKVPPGEVAERRRAYDAARREEKQRLDRARYSKPVGKLAEIHRRRVDWEFPGASDCPCCDARNAVDPGLSELSVLSFAETTKSGGVLEALATVRIFCEGCGQRSLRYLRVVADDPSDG